MAIDLRAYSYCNLGPLVEASIADSYIQDSGLILCRGTATIRGIITPDSGTIIEFAYAKNGRLARIPRRLRVLSSSANPYTNLTALEIGCKLTYLQDLQSPDERVLRSINDPYGLVDVPPNNRAYAPAYISAQWVFEKCLQNLDITSFGAVLTNKFITEKFDMSAPYVEILGNILKSETQFGYLDINEVLQVRSLYDTSTTGPLFNNASIIEIESIGIGELPGEAVFVPFASRKLKPPNASNNSKINWEQEESVNSTKVIIKTASRSVTYSVLERMKTETYYKIIPVFRRTGSVNVKTTTAEGRIFNTSIATGYEKDEDKEVVDKRVTTKTSETVSAFGSLAAARIEAGGNFASGSYQEVTTTNYYYDGEGNEISSTEETREAAVALRGRTGVPVGPFGTPTALGFDQYFVSVGGQSPSILSKKIIKKVDTTKGYQQTTTETYVHYIDTQEGQQAIASASESIRDKQKAENFLSDVVGSGIFLQSVNVESRRTGEDTSEERPNQTERTANASTKGSDRTIDGLTVEVPSVVLAYGSAQSQRYIELSMPYVPDDHVRIVGTSAFIVLGDARQKALSYGIIQNRLRLANRSGINIKVPPEPVPPEPYAPCYVQAAGTTGFYRVNGCSWTLSNAGIACSLDLLYWGVVGQSTGGTNWLPVAPGITTLPVTPAITGNGIPVPAFSTPIPSGFNLNNPNLTTLFNTTLPTTGAPVYPQTMTPVIVVPPYDITYPYQARIRIPSIARLVPPANVLDVATAGISIYNSHQGGLADLLLDFEGTPGSKQIIDSSVNNYVPTSVSGNAALATGGITGKTFYFIPLSDWDPFGNNDETAICYKNNNIFNPGEGDFTIECWLNLSERRPIQDESGEYTFWAVNAYDLQPNMQLSQIFSGSFDLYDANYDGFASPPDWRLDIGLSQYNYVSGNIVARFQAYSTPAFNNIFTPNQWNHFAAARKDGELSIWWNGQEVVDFFYTESFGSLGINNPEYSELRIGSYDEYGYYTWSGGIDGLGIHKYAKYIKSFSPSRKLFRSYVGQGIVPSAFLEGGTFDLQGSNANFISGYELSANGTSLTITSPVADLYRFLFADSGSINVASEDVILSPAIIIADSGSLTLTAEDADLIYFVPSDPNFSNVELLLHMNGANNSTTFTDSSSHALAADVFGNTKITTNQSKFGGASAVFDGTGDYIRYANNGQWNLSNVNFTVELFVRPTTLKLCTFIGLNGADWRIQGNANGTLSYVCTSGGSGFTTTATIAINTWYHLALEKNGATTTLYLDGVAVGSTTLNPVNTNAGFLYVGTNGDATSTWSCNAHIDEVRVTRGIARYGGAFTPPVQQFLDITAYSGDFKFSDVTLLLHMDGSNGSTTFVDSSNGAVAITANGDAQITTSNSRFGSGSATFDGTGDYLSTPSSSAFNFSGTAFTVECWFRPANTTQSGRSIFSQRIAPVFAPFEVRQSGTGVSWLIANAAMSSWASTASSATGIITANTWHHIALVGNGSTVVLYVNGVSRLSATQSAWTSANRTMYFGSGGDGAYTGQIDEIRITKGFARWTANFITPTAPFPDS